MEEKIRDMLVSQTNPTIGIYVGFAEVRIRISAKAADEAHAKQLIEPVAQELYDRLVSRPQLLPEGFLHIAYQEGIERAVVDYISGMSDEFATRMFVEQFVPQKWHVL